MDYSIGKDILHTKPFQTHWRDADQEAFLLARGCGDPSFVTKRYAGIRSMQFRV